MTRKAQFSASENQLLAAIAKKTLYMDTLETRNSDSLDFSEVSVWGVREALELAYQAGIEAANAKA